MNPHNLYPHRCLCAQTDAPWTSTALTRKDGEHPLYLGKGHMAHVPRQSWPLENETHKPFAHHYRTQNLRDSSSVMQQLHVKERSESSNLSLGFPVSWAKPGGTTRHLSQFRRSVFNVSHAHLQPKTITTIKTMLWEWFQNCCLIWKWKTKANKLRQC